MRRREFIAGLRSAVALPVVARAQQGERVRCIGVLMAWDESDSAAQGWSSACMQGPSELGRTGGRNVRMDIRWSGDRGDAHQTQTESRSFQAVMLPAIAAES
jgi:putative tryptophan/tyrosine transport system substrate-binding protein